MRIKNSFNTYTLPYSSLGLIRIVYGMFSIFIIGVPNYAQLSATPDYLYHPPVLSLGFLLKGYPPYWILLLVSIILLILSCFVLFGYKTKFSSIALSIGYLLGQNLIYSSGKIDHDILYLLFPGLMAFSNWGTSYSIDSKHLKSESKGSGSFIHVAILLGFAMFTAGLPKLLTGWLSLDTQAVLSNIIIYNCFDGPEDYFLCHLDYHQNVIWEALDYLVVLLEVGFLFAIIKPRLFRLFIFFALLFHLGTYYFLGILFQVHLIIYFLFMSPFLLDKIVNAIAINSIVSIFFSFNFFIVFILFVNIQWGLSIYICSSDCLFPVSIIAQLIQFVVNDYLIFLILPLQVLLIFIGANGLYLSQRAKIP